MSSGKKAFKLYSTRLLASNTLCSYSKFYSIGRIIKIFLTVIAVMYVLIFVRTLMEPTNTIVLPVCILICRSLGMPTRNGYPLLMKPSSNVTCCSLYHSDKKTPGTNLSRVQFQNVTVLFTRCKI